MSEKQVPSTEELRVSLRRVGIRLTAQREAVWDLFAGEGRGYTLGAAALALRERDVAPATVYRTVNLLADMGFLLPVLDRGGERRFVARRPGHTHVLVCRRCSRAEPFSTCGFGILERLLEAETGYQILEHNLEVYGVCPECAKDSK